MILLTAKVSYSTYLYHLLLLLLLLTLLLSMLVPFTSSRIRCVQWILSFIFLAILDSLCDYFRFCSLTFNEDGATFHKEKGHYGVLERVMMFETILKDEVILLWPW